MLFQNSEMPFITAYSGCMDTPMGSMESVVRGLESGADIIEVDVRRFKDSIVLGHEPISGEKKIHWSHCNLF